MQTAGIILAGGRSTRMGTPKALLEWHGSTLVQLAAETVTATVTGPVIVMRARGQFLPPLPAATRVLDDRGTGPLNAIEVGMAALDGHADRAIVCAVDAPFLTSTFLDTLLEALTADADVAVPFVQGRRHPIPAAFRLTVRPSVTRLVADGEQSVRALIDGCRCVDVSEDRLRAVDPTLASLRNLNTPDDYEAARSESLVTGARTERHVPSRSGPRDRISP